MFSSIELNAHSLANVFPAQNSPRNESNSLRLAQPGTDRNPFTVELR
jgi:hypothetical protein